jgi:hypothetical protein
MADWDPEIDAPAVVAILGAGPIGIEAALYARFLGYDVLLFDQGKVAGNVLKWGHVKMLTPFKDNSSSLGLRALLAQDENFKPPAADDCLTGHQYATQYLVPLAKTDLIYDGVHVHSRVVSISRVQTQREDDVPGDERGGDEFRLLIDSKSRGLWTARADIVIDTTGNSNSPRGIAPGGGVPLASAESLADIQSGWIDVAGAKRETVLGKKVLLVGSGLSAATIAAAMESVIASDQATQLTWVTLPGEDGKPTLRPQSIGKRCNEAAAFDQLAYNQLLERSKLLLSGTVDGVVPIAAWGIERLDRTAEGQTIATLLVGFEETLSRTCDVVIQATGSKPCWDFAEPLRIGRCHVSDGPIGVASALASPTGSHLGKGYACDSQSLMTTEPNYYVLGSKSFGSISGFLIQDGLMQIRSLFALIGGRSDLDLYERSKNSAS